MQTRIRRNGWLSCFVWVAMACLGMIVGHAEAQDQVVTSRPCHFDANAAPVVGPACLLARVSLGALPVEAVYWHLDTFADVATANAAKDARGVVVEDYGKTWLFTIAPKAWHAKGSTRVAVIGPLPTKPAKAFDAEYIHSMFAPGTTAPVHKHSGPEAFYALAGDTCLEMPDGMHVAKGPGNTLVMPGGEPMLLMATGATARRAFALVLHDATQPATTRVTEWKPAGLCQADAGGA